MKMINKATIIDYCDEFTDKYPVTIEFSEHVDKLPQLFKKLKKHTPSNLAWTAHTCSTCEEYHGKGYVHIELHKVDSIHAGYEASNLLCTTKDLTNIEQLPNTNDLDIHTQTAIKIFEQEEAKEKKIYC